MGKVLHRTRALSAALLVLTASAGANAVEHVLYVSGENMTTGVGAVSSYFAHSGDLSALGAADGVWTGDCTTLSPACGALRESNLQFPTPTYSCSGDTLTSVIVEYRYKIDWKAADSNEVFQVNLNGTTSEIKRWAATGVTGGAPYSQASTDGTYTLSPTPTRTNLASAVWTMLNDGEIKFDYIRLRVEDGCTVPPVVQPVTTVQSVPATGLEALVAGSALVALVGLGAVRRRRSGKLS